MASENEKTKNEKDNYVKDILRSITNMDYIRPEEVPNIDLYMDQVTTFMDRHLESSKRYPDDKLLTKTMINNYAKNNIIPPPDKKKYSPDHMFMLMFIYYMKNIMSITDIHTLLGPLTECCFNKDGFNMKDVYSEIFGIEEKQEKEMVKDLLKKLNASKTAFEGVGKTPEEDEYFKIFAFVCMLCFDVYMKSQVIEHLLDSNECFKTEDKNKNKNDKAKNEKPKAEAKQPADKDKSESKGDEKNAGSPEDKK